MEFEVIDNTTGEGPDCEHIVRTEEWAKHLLVYDIDCFALRQDGTLVLMDDCDGLAYCPEGRFTVVFGK